MSAAPVIRLGDDELVIESDDEVVARERLDRDVLKNLRQGLGDRVEYVVVVNLVARALAGAAGPVTPESLFALAALLASLARNHRIPNVPNLVVDERHDGSVPFDEARRATDEEFEELESRLDESQTVRDVLERLSE